MSWSYSRFVGTAADLDGSNNYTRLINDQEALERLWRGMARVHEDLFKRLVEAQVHALDLDDIVLEADNGGAR